MESVEPVGRIAIKFVGHPLGKNFVGRVQTKDKRIEDGVFGTLDFVVRYRFLRQILDVFVCRLNRFDRALTLGADAYLQNAGMAEVGPDASADAIGQAALGADVVKQARGESAAEGFIENADRVVVGIIARGAERDHVNVALVHVFLRNQIIAGLGRLVFDFVLGKRWPFRPGVEGGA